MANKPTATGLRRSFGFGDWLGLAGPGHRAVARQFPEVMPFLVQFSGQPWDRPGQSAGNVLAAAEAAVDAVGFAGPWGADADGLTTVEVIRSFAAAGFTHYTLDVSAAVGADADQLDEAALRERGAALEAAGASAGFDWKDYYIGRFFSVGHRINPLQFDEEDLLRAAVKYSRATMLAEELAAAVANACANKPFEIEINVAGSPAVTTSLDHLFLALELQRRGIPNLAGLGLHYEGLLVPGIDFQGDVRKFEDRLRVHAGIAKFAGPYKLSFHAAADKFALYPAMGRLCGHLLHLKTAHTSYLEALRVVARTDAALFAEVVAYSRACLADPGIAGATLITPHQLASLPQAGSSGDEDTFLDHLVGRQVLAAAAKQVLSPGSPAAALRLRDRITDSVSRNAALYAEVLERHFVRHLSLLNAG